MSAAANAQGASDAKRKRAATIQAHLAMAGFELVEMADGSFMIRRWGLSSRPLADIEAAESFARMVGIKIDAAQ